MNVFVLFVCLWDALAERGATLDELTADGEARNNTLVGYATYAREAFVAFGGQRDDFAPLVERALDDDPEALDAMAGLCGWLDENLPAILERAKEPKPKKKRGRPRTDPNRDRAVYLLFVATIEERFPGASWADIDHGHRRKTVTQGVQDLIHSAGAPGGELSLDRLERIYKKVCEDADRPVATGFPRVDRAKALGMLIDEFSTADGNS